MSKMSLQEATIKALQGRLNESKIKEYLVEDNKVKKEVEINGYQGTLYSQDEIDCFNAMCNTIHGLENYVSNFDINLSFGPKHTYIDFTTSDGEGTFTVLFSTDTFGKVESVQTRFSNQEITDDFIKLSQALYELKK